MLDCLQHFRVQGYELVLLDWPKVDVKEGFSSFVAKVNTLLPHSETSVNLLGVSMGGMIAQEVAKLRKLGVLILVSSVYGASQLPFYFQLGRFTPFYKLVNKQSHQLGANFLSLFFGRMQPAIKKVFVDMYLSADVSFVRWAIREIPRWKLRGVATSRLIHLVGSRDLIFPLFLYDSSKVHIVNGGGHNMIMTHASVINKYLEQELS